EENLVACDFRILKIDRFNFDECKVAFAIFRRTHLSGDRVTGAQIELANLRRRDIDVVGAWQIVVFRSAQEAEAVGETLQYSFRKDEAAFFRLGAQDLEDQLLLAHAARAGNI